MRRYRFKPFDPKPFEPGAVVEWRHFPLVPEDTPYIKAGPGVVRRGVVWSGAPTADGRRHVWVIPDESLDDDPYRAICVRVPAARESERGTGPLSSNGLSTTTGRAMAHAAEHARWNREERRPA